MARFGRVRPALYLAGAALAVGCLVGARALTAGSGPADAPKTAAPPAGGKAAGGPVVLGTVDSDPPPVSYGLPPVLPSGTVAEVFVRDGQEVKAGEKLYAFDTTVPTRKLEKAAANVAFFKAKVDEATEGVKRHAGEITVMKQALKAANDKRDRSAAYHELVLANLRENRRQNNPNQTDAEFQALLNRNTDLYNANLQYTVALNEAATLQAKLGVLEAADPQVVVREAKAAVEVAEAERREAQSVIDLCTVVARRAGTVEQVKVSEGSTLGVSSRDPALWLIPAGPRVVRAEVEADFAHRVGDDIKGREVTIADHTDPKLTYRGKVLRPGNTFLPKRGEALVPSDTRVLEVLVEVLDPAPAGRPPLRIGQRVRVNLGQ
jgi:multidrug resistance efflux pump